MRVLFLLMFVSILFGGGVLVGYFIGRRAGRRQSQQGFPVVPMATVSATQDNARETRRSD